MNLKSGDYCWLSGEGWIYLGQIEDGSIHFYRPVESSQYPLIEFNTLYPADEPKEYDRFMADNGLETFTERFKRKGVDLP